MGNWRRSRTDFVDKADHIPCLYARSNISGSRQDPSRAHLVFDVFDQSLELLLELATDTRPCDDRSQVDGQHSFMLKRLEGTVTSTTRREQGGAGAHYLRDFLCDYPLGEPLEDGSFTDTGRTDKLQQ